MAWNWYKMRTRFQLSACIFHTLIKICQASASEERRRETRTPCGFRFGGESVGNWPLVDFNQEIVCDAEESQKGKGREIAKLEGWTARLGEYQLLFCCISNSPPAGLSADQRNRNRKGFSPNWALQSSNAEIAGSGLGAVFVRFAPRGKLGKKEGGGGETEIGRASRISPPYVDGFEFWFYKVV